jgi:hypothetical protein
VLPAVVVTLRPALPALDVEGGCVVLLAGTEAVPGVSSDELHATALPLQQTAVSHIRAER